MGVLFCFSFQRRGEHNENPFPRKPCQLTLSDFVVYFWVEGMWKAGRASAGVFGGIVCEVRGTLPTEGLWGAGSTGHLHALHFSPQKHCPDCFIWYETTSLRYSVRSLLEKLKINGEKNIKYHSLGWDIYWKCLTPQIHRIYMLQVEANHVYTAQHF